MKAIRIIVNGNQARYNPAPDRRLKFVTVEATEETEEVFYMESDEDFLARVAQEVGGEVVEETEIVYPEPPPLP